AQMTVGAEGDQFPSGDERGVGSGRPDGGDEQGRGGGLPVGSGRTYHRPLRRHHLEQLGSPPDGDAGPAGGVELGVALGHGRGGDDQVHLGDPFGATPLPHFDPERREEIGRGSGPEIGSGEPIPTSGEDLGEGAHAGATDADDVDTLGQVGHEDAISIRARAMTVAASGLASFVAASAMRRRASTSDTSSSTAARSSVRRSSVTTTAAPASRRAAALAAWCLPDPKPPGTRIAGVAVAVSSATEPPARATTRSHAAKNASISAMKSSTTHR